MKKLLRSIVSRFSFKQFLIGVLLFSVIKFAIDYFVYPDKHYEFAQAPYWIGFAITALLGAFLFSLWVSPKEK